MQCRVLRGCRPRDDGDTRTALRTTKNHYSRQPAASPFRYLALGVFWNVRATSTAHHTSDPYPALSDIVFSPSVSRPHQHFALQASSIPQTPTHLSPPPTTIINMSSDEVGVVCCALDPPLTRHSSKPKATPPSPQRTLPELCMLPRSSTTRPNTSDQPSAVKSSPRRSRSTPPTTFCTQTAPRATPRSGISTRPSTTPSRPLVRRQPPPSSAPANMRKQS